MNLLDACLKKPHALLAFVFLGVAFGLIGFKTLPLNLFPDSNYPQVSVLLIQPGASARDMADTVARQVEKELASLDKVRTVTATIRDETAAVKVEFDYAKSLDAAVTDVSAAINRVLPSLPADLLPPRIFRISDATAPVKTLAVSPAKGSVFSLSRVRQICDNEIRETLLRIPGIAGVEVFGGHVPEIRLVLDRHSLSRYGLSPAGVAAAVAGQNRNLPSGLLLSNANEQVITLHGERGLAHGLSDIVLSGSGPADTVYLRDVAEIQTTFEERRSLFRANGKAAIGLNILRSEGGSVTETLAALDQALPELRDAFPGLVFDIADTQGELIETSVSNLISALRDSVLLTVAVIFMLMARGRTTLLAAVSIPFTFFLTFAGMTLIGYELNMVTMTAIILAVGLLVDDTIVVIENIDRHMAPGDTPPDQAARKGVREIFMADFAGTATTLVVLVPIMFVGGYAQKILRPLSVVLSLALLSSFIVSVTVIPLLAPKLIKAGHHVNRLERFFDTLTGGWLLPLERFFVRCYRLTTGRLGFLFPLALIVLLLISVRQMPLIGRDLMPAMDTGIVKIEFETWPNSSLSVTEKVIRDMEAVILSTPGFVRMAVMVGSEPGVISFGADRTAQEGLATVHFKNRFERDRTIWEIEAELRRRFTAMPGLKQVRVYDYGATPLSSISAPVDVMIEGPDLLMLDSLAREVEKRLEKVRGLTSLARTWDLSKQEIAVDPDRARMAHYCLTEDDVVAMVTTATTGRTVSRLSVAAQDGYPVRLRLDPLAMADQGDLADLRIPGPFGTVPLNEIADIRKVTGPSRITRRDLMPVVSVLGYRETTAITHLQDQVDALLSDLSLPAGYRISQRGEIRQMKETFGGLGLSMGLALLFLYVSMVVTFASFVRPLMVMSTIPLAFIGVPWGMLLFSRHFCMPAAMGLVLLGGIVVNNAILLMDFIGSARQKGTDVNTAIEEAIGRRTRPILMTALSTIAGMLPVAFESAVGLERLSPLAVVAIAGLLVSTVLTLVFIPMLAFGIETFKQIRRT
ncbi:efflux RND transporter permease subunit [Desulfatiferula olefinivorans]